MCYFVGVEVFEGIDVELFVGGEGIVLGVEVVCCGGGL